MKCEELEKRQNGNWVGNSGQRKLFPGGSTEQSQEEVQRSQPQEEGDVVLEYGTACAKVLWQETCR